MGWSPSKKPVSVMTMRSKRSGRSTKQRMPMGPPQSWTTAVAPRTSSASSQASRTSVWRS
jgi:hypothetical protein